MRSSVLCLAMLSTSLLPYAAQAQMAVAPQATETPVAPGQTTGPTAAPQTAAVDAAESTGLEDIIVTATKRSENLQAVPVSITAITADALTAKGVFSTADLNNSIPNLNVSSAYGETQPNFTLRGIGVGTEYNSNAASPVGVYVDEVYQSFRASHGQQLYDLNQVEVVRGPQGTLFGRNTTGGAINFITRKPKLAGTEGYVTAGYGSFNRINGEGAIEFTAIPDVLGFRFAGTYVDSDPYVKNRLPFNSQQTSPNIPLAIAVGNPTSGISPGGHESYGFRGSVRFKPTDTLEINAKAYFARSVGGQDSPQNAAASLTSDIIDIRTTGFAFLYSDPTLVPFLPAPYSPSANGLDDREIMADTIGMAKTLTKGAVLNVQLELADNLDLISISGYDTTHFELLPRIDCDGTPFDVCAIGYESHSRSFNQDVRLNYSGDRFKLIAGLYYGYDRIVSENIPDFFGYLSDVNAARGNPKTYFNPGYLLGFTFPQLPTRLFANQNFTQIRKSSAVYGEASYEVTDTVKVTAGIRYTKDKFSYNALTTFFDDAGNARLYTVSNYAPGGVFQNYQIGVSPGTAGELQRRDSSSAVTGRAIVDWKVAEDVLLYASYSRGYRGGTYNGLAFQSANQVYFVPPETVNAFEVGIKSRFFDNRLQFNASLFNYDYKKQQSQLIDPSSVTFLTSLDGKLTGVDAELIFVATDQLRLTAGLGYLDSKFDDGACPAALITGQPPQVGNCIATPGGNINVGGNPFPYASKYSVNVGFDWRIIETSDGKLTLFGDASYASRYFYDFFGAYDYTSGTNSSVGLARGPHRFGQPAYVLLGGRITYATERYSVSAYVKNATDKLYYPNGINVEGSYGSDYRVRAAPRTFGAEATFRF